MTAFLTQVTEVLTWILTSVGSVSEVVMDQPLMLTPYVIALAGAGVGFFVRLVRG